ncbi:MAG TPA: aminopeptidase, partial [Solirubrobacteraceae bacterium]|nr:aminopeptidase [Solirubrobacteraceae bacterium]
GQGIASTIPDDAAGERLAAGLNVSRTHTDFMVGSAEIEVDGIDREGRAVPLLRGGRWQLDG